MTATRVEPFFLRADAVWLDGWRGPGILRAERGTLRWVGPADDSTEDIAARIPGTLAAGFTDSHVHLSLIDPSAFAGGGIARVVDLGGDPAVVSALKARADVDPGAVEVRFAGAFLTASGGYPGDRSWAAPGSVIDVDDAASGAVAIHAMRDAGAELIKVALNSVAGPVWDDELLVAIVEEAHAVGLPVVAHCEGPGQAIRAARAGVDLLSHTPWTELFSEEETAILADSVAIISTLDIHGYGTPSDEHAIAVANLTRFHAAGGRIRYGTDLGNGPLPIGLNTRELSAMAVAGLGRDALLASLTDVGLGAEPTGFARSVTCLADAPSADAPGDEVVAWLDTASVVSVLDLKEYFA